MTRGFLLMAAAGFAVTAVVACATFGPAAYIQANAPVAADSELALALLRHVIEEGDEVSFRATQTVILWYPAGSSACITNVVHKAPNLTRTEYLPSATARSAYRIVITDGQSAWHYEPSLGVVFHMPGAGPQRNTQPGQDGPVGAAAGSGSDTMSLIEANYRVSLVTTESLAGRKAHVIELQPRYAGNPSRKMWVDAELPFILRTEKYRPDGPIASLSFYNHVEFNPVIKDDAFKIRVPPGVAIVTLPGSGDLVPVEELQKKAGFVVAMPTFVPDGYVLEGGALSLRGNVQVAHIRFTDGLNTISYFVAPLGVYGGVLPDGPTSTGQLDMVSLGKKVVLDGVKGQLADYHDAKLLRWRAPSYEFTLIGEVDESLLVTMAQSVRPPEPRERAREPFPGQVIKFFYQFLWVGK